MAGDIGEIMKTLLILLTLITTSLTAHAQQSKIAFSKDFMLPNVGTLKVDVIDYFEAIDMPYMMNVKVLCADKRSQKNVVQPTWEDVVSSKQISELVGFMWLDKNGNQVDEQNPSRTQIQLRFCLKAGGCKPLEDKIRVFDLPELCKAWRQ